MSDFHFTVTDGPYSGVYDIDLSDLSSLDALDVRKVLGVPLIQAANGAVDIDVAAVLVWLVRRRSSKGLAFGLVAESLNYGNLDFDQSSGDEAGSVDPTTLGTSDAG